MPVSFSYQKWYWKDANVVLIFHSRNILQLLKIKLSWTWKKISKELSLVLVFHWTKQVHTWRQPDDFGIESKRNEVTQIITFAKKIRSKSWQIFFNILRNWAIFNLSLPPRWDDNAYLCQCPSYVKITLKHFLFISGLNHFHTSKDVPSVDTNYEICQRCIY